MRKFVVFGLLATVVTVIGCKDNVFDPDRFIRDVDPDFVVQGRQVQVTVHGEFTHWSSTDTQWYPAVTVDNVDFGPGVVVDAVTVVNEGVLIIDVTADPAAVYGPRDVDIAGEIYPGVFRVTPPFEVVEGSQVAPGRLFSMIIRGYDTLWMEDFTTVNMGPNIHFGPDGNGDEPLLGLIPLGATVMRDDLILVQGWVNVFAPVGEISDATITGLTGSDTATGWVTIEDPSIVTLGDDDTETVYIENPYQTVVVDTVSAVEGKVKKIYGRTNGTGFMLAFDQNVSGVMWVNPGPFYGDGVGLGLRGDTNFGYATGDTLRYVFFDGYHSVADQLQMFFGPKPDDYPPSISHSASTKTSATLVTGQTLTGETTEFNSGVDAANDANWYDIVPAAPWTVAEVTVAATAGGASSLDARIGSQPRQTFTPYQYSNGVTGDTDVARVLLTNQPFSFLGVSNGFLTIGSPTSYDLGFSELTPPGTRVQGGGTPMTISTNPGGTATATVNTGGQTVTELYLYIELDHTYMDDVELLLTSPTGTVRRLCSSSPTFGGDGTTCRSDGVPISSQGIAELYYSAGASFTGTYDVVNVAGAGNDGLLSDFAGEAADGDWTLQVNDTYTFVDVGTVHNWGLYVVSQ